MYRRYRRTTRHRNSEYKRRSFGMRPVVQIIILLLAVLAVFIILSSAGK